MKNYLFILITFCSSFDLISQGIGINSTGALANNDAGLDVDFANKGILIPRVNLINLTTFNPPITNNGNTASLLVFNTNNAIGQGYYYWDGTQWVKLITELDAWMLTGNAGTVPTVNFIGTTDNADFVVKTNNTERVRILSNGNIGVNINNPVLSIQINQTDAIGIPSGTTAQRPANPPVGSLRFNTTTGVTEVFNGNCWQNVNTPPIGATYIQWFNAADPNTIYPCTQWVATDITNGEFIRARGGESNVASNAPLTGIVQQHAMQQHQHTGTITINNATGLSTNSAGSHNHGGFTGGYNDIGSGCGNPKYVPYDDNINNSTFAVATGNSPSLTCPWNAEQIAGNFLGRLNNELNHNHSISADGNHTHTIPPHNHTGTVIINNVSGGANTNANETRPTNVAVIFWRRIN